jgi:hypothetical protein
MCRRLGEGFRTTFELGGGDPDGLKALHNPKLGTAGELPVLAYDGKEPHVTACDK